MTRLLAAIAAAIAGAVGLLLGSAAPASAHPSDELLQQVYVTPTAQGVELDLELTPGVLVGRAFASLIDTDGDGAITEDEAAAHADHLQKAVTLTVDGRRTTLQVARTTYPNAEVLTAGGGTVKVVLAADAAATGSTRVVTVTDAYAPATDATGPIKTTVQANVTLTAGSRVEVGPIERRDGGRTLTARYDQAATAAGSSGGAAAEQSAGQSTGGSGPGSYMLAALQRPLGSRWALATLLAGSAVLGALHALTPGHGKALLAAYLVGERGTPRQAVALGSVVTFTHTASVIGIGVAVLAAGHYVVPGVLVPGLEVGAGLLVALLGVRLVVRRWQGRHAAAPHGHDHDHRHHDHGHGHPEPHFGATGRAALLTMGVSGGIVPCPEALGVLLLAVGVHRTALGLAMIVAFSAGLAVILVGLGLVLVTARLGHRIRRAGNRSTWLAQLIPLGSAVVVAVLGLAMAMGGISSLAAR